MMATLNSIVMGRGVRHLLLHGLAALWMGVLGLAGLAGLGAAEGDMDPEAAFRERAEQEYQRARAEHRSDPDDAMLAWQFGQATFHLAEVAHNRQEREVLAQEGIEACRRAISLEPGLAAAHYYLGMNLGQLARVYLLRGLRIVGEMERAFEKSRELEPGFDHGGSDRNLGLLYHKAPGWPISVGNKRKGREHLERAVRLSPGYPENRLCLAEALWDTRRHEAFVREVRALEKLLPEAREVFDPDVWTWGWAWVDWDERWATLQERLRTVTKVD